MQFHSHANQSYFHNGFALRLALKQRHKGTRKWPIDPFASFACQTADNCDVVKGRFGDVYRFMSRHMCRSLCAFLSRSLINGCYAWWHMIRLAKISTTPRLESANFSPKKKFQGFNGIRSYGLCVSVAVLYQLSYEDPYLLGTDEEAISEFPCASVSKWV